MRGLVLNEKKVAEEIIEKSIMTESAYNSINILIKHYYLENKAITKLDLLYKILGDLDRCMGSAYKRIQLEETITKRVNYFFKSIKKYGDENVKLSNIDKIVITKEECERIKSIKDKKTQRVMFIMLVYCRATNELNSNKSYWMNQPIKNIMAEAKITRKNDKTDILHYLYLNGLITDNARIDKVSYRVNYVCEESEDGIVITDFDECIHYWLIYIGEKWKKCSECGKWVKVTNNRVKYCKDCAKRVNIEKTKNNKKVKNAS